MAATTNEKLGLVLSFSTVSVLFGTIEASYSVPKNSRTWRLAVDRDFGTPSQLAQKELALKRRIV
jgi:hypothetical protein